jgi:TonB family protein
MRRYHLKQVLNLLSALGVFAFAIAAPSTSLSLATDASGLTPPGAPVLDGVEVTYDASQQITWYKPKVDPWKMFDFRIYPSIGRADDGARKTVIIVLVKDPPKGRPTSLQIDAGEESWIVPILEAEEIKAHDSGCRVTQTIVLQNQASFVHNLADATEVKIAFAGYQHPVHYKMTPEDLTNFRRIAALSNAPVLPPAPSKPVSEGSAAGTIAAGATGITNPVLIPSSKVQPRFPKFAEGKNVLGRVELAAVVRKDGTVGDIEVRQGAGGDCGFEEAAIEAVSKWRYKPGTKDGQPVDVYFTVVIDFTYGRYRMAHG